MKKSKALKETLVRLHVALPLTAEKRRNPFSGQVRLLEPEAAQLYDFITAPWFPGAYTRATWDNARYFFRHHWPEEYMALLD